MDTIKSDWINAVINYVQNTQPKCLDLSHKGVNIEEIKPLLNCVRGSQVRELILTENNLRNEGEALSKTLVNSKIEILKIEFCELTIEDIFKLLEVLKFTKITELYAGGNMDLPSEESYYIAEERDTLIKYVRESDLKAFDFSLYSFRKADYEPLVKALLSSKITKLSLDKLDRESLISLAKNLHFSSVTELTFLSESVYSAEQLFNEETVRALSQAIRKSELKKLVLEGQDMDDDGVDILVKGLVCSGLTELSLNGNKISGSNSLGLRLKDTAIQTLDLSNNRLSQHGIFLCPDLLKFSSLVKLEIRRCFVEDLLFQKLVRSLKFSKITYLDASVNGLQLPGISDFAKALKDTSLERIDFSNNRGIPPEGMILLAESVPGSKLKHINVSKCFKGKDPNKYIPLFVAKTKGSSLESLEIASNGLTEAGAELLALALKDSTLTYLNLSSNEIGNGVSNLAEQLKFTSLSCLKLNMCKITDEGVIAVANHLKDTQLIELHLEENRITCHGAKALAACLKDSKLLRLNVLDNAIKEDGFKALAQGAENTYITTLSIFNSCLPFIPRPNEPEQPKEAERYLVEAVVVRNAVAAHSLTETFKQIAPVDNCNFRFLRDDVACTSDFLHQCLELYWNITHKPAAVKVLKEDASILFSSEEILALMEEEFPKQFCFFIASGVEASLEEHIDLLRKAEDRSLNKIVEYLLLNRPLYLIDKTNGILHPYVYKLLDKYNYALYNVALEPEGKTKILNYFSKLGDSDDALDVVRLLRCKRKQ